MFNLFSAAAWLIGVTTSGIAFVMLYERRNAYQILWGAFCAAAAVWGWSSLAIALTAYPERAELLWRIVTVSIIFIPVFFAHIVYHFSSLRRPAVLGVLYGPAVILAGLTFVDSLMIDGVRLAFGRFYYLLPGPLFPLIVVNYGASVVFALMRLLYVRTTIPGGRRAQAGYLILGALTGFIGGGFNFIPVWGPDLYPALPNFAVALGTVVVSYSIFRYRLPDIRSALRVVAVYLFLTLVAYIGFYAIAGVYTYFWGSVFAAEARATHVVGALAMGVVFSFFAQNAKRLAIKHINKQSYATQRALTSLSQKLPTIIDLDELTATISTTIKETLRASRTQVMITQEAADRQLEYGLDQRALRTQTISPGDLTRILEKTGRVVVADELERMAQDATRDRAAERTVFLAVRSNMRKIGAAVSAPLMTHGSLVGVIVLGARASGDPYSKEDIDMLQVIAGSASVAIENALLYSQSRAFSTYLQKEVARATRELKDANKELRRLDKAKTEFLNIASHQLYTPLTSIRGYASMASDGDYGEVSPQLRPVLDMIDTSAKRLVELTRNLLDITRIESGQTGLALRRVLLEPLIDTTIAELQPEAAAKKLTVTWQKPSEPMPAVIGDPMRLQQIILNFIDNAIKYTEKGHITVTLQREGDELVFAVVDTGQGLPPEEIDHLFKKFERLASGRLAHTEGVGLGLYVAHRIAHEHHGSVGAESKGLQQGSRFFVRLPIEGTPNSLTLPVKQPTAP